MDQHGLWNFSLRDGKTYFSPHMIRFLTRLGVAACMLLLVMYLYRTWFLGQKHGHPLNQTTGNSALRAIEWWQANSHYGEYAAVEGKIVLTHNTGKVCFLNFHPNYKNHFTAVIFASDFSKFPAQPEKYYHGKKVRIRGYIKEYKGKPEIVVNNPSQMEILP